MKKRIIVAVIVLLIIVGSIGIALTLVATKPTPPTNKPTEVVINVKEYVAHNDAFEIKLDYPARVVAKDIVKLGTPVSGRIIDGDVELRNGGKFKKGDLILSIYCNDIEASLKAQKSQLLSTLAIALPDIKVDFPEQAEKWMNFFEDIDISSPLPKLPKIESTKEKVYISAKGILTNYYSVEQAEMLVAKYKVYAPFNGVFRDITKTNGALTSAGADVGTIVSTDVLELTIGLTPLEAKLVNVGKKVKIRSNDEKVYYGTIKRISPLVNQSTQRVTVYVELREPSLEIIQGQMVEVTLELNKLENVIRVPREIINKDNEIYRIENNKLYSMPVDIIMVSGEYSFIRGIEDGTPIIYESLILPKDGTTIRVIEKVEHSNK